VTVRALTPVAEALDTAFLRYGAVWLPVVDDAGHFLGISHRDRVQAASEGGDGWLTMGSMLDNDPAAGLQVDEDRPLTELLSLEQLGRLGAVVAVDGQGILRGVVTLDQVRRALRSIFPVTRPGA
jgi:CBS domain-containing protein